VFIQIMQARCTRQDEMRQVIDEASAGLADKTGWLGGTFGFTDDGRFVGVVRFESEEACRELTGSETAKAWLERARELCDEPVEVHESGDVTMVLEGGSDSAGFVQVMRGRIADQDRFRHLSSDEMMTMLHEMRPEVIGATLAVEPDGTFTETVAFTDESSARRGEQNDMPAEVAADLGAAMADVEYLDLHKPWFASHR
jgi:hypothetical protein